MVIMLSHALQQGNQDIPVVNTVLDIDPDFHWWVPIDLLFDGFKHPIPFHTNGPDSGILLPSPGHLVNVAGGKKLAILVFERHVKEHSWEEGAKMALG